VRRKRGEEKQEAVGRKQGNADFMVVARQEGHAMRENGGRSRAQGKHKRRRSKEDHKAVRQWTFATYLISYLPTQNDHQDA
jgi:hypothetical protein